MGITACAPMIAWIVNLRMWDCAISSNPGRTFQRTALKGSSLEPDKSESEYVCIVPSEPT